MSRLELPHHLSAAFEEAVNLLSTGLPEGCFVLSGGSVLRALWGHPTSTDLDFFLPGDAINPDPGLRRDRAYDINLHGIPQAVASAVEQRNAHLIPVAVPSRSGKHGRGRPSRKGAPS